MKHLVLAVIVLVLGFGARPLPAQDAPPPPQDHKPMPPNDGPPPRQWRPGTRGRQHGDFRQNHMMPRDGFRPGGMGNRDPFGGGRGGAGFLERLRRENPEEYERLSKLYQEDRRAFMEEVKKMMHNRRGGRRMSPEEQKCQELSRLYHEAKDDDERAAIRQELEVAVQKAFEVRLESSRERIARLEEQLTKFREHIAALEENREKICKGRVEELLRPPELKWDSNW